MEKTPLYLWIVGVVSLLWNAGGAMNYVMTKTNAAEYMAAQPAARLMMLEQAPMWFNVTWAVGVWFSVIGALLGASIYTYMIADGGSMLAVAGTTDIAFTIAIPVILIGLWVYARTMTRRGVLR